jgi:NAD(P)-dependent dehydrogenase (short-subunit alcohol dehydrogenase family)
VQEVAAAHGAAVAIFDYHKDNGEARAAALRSRGAKAIAIQGDASRKEDLQRALREVLAAFGAVDVLINAAGINSATPFFEIAEAEWQRILDVNLKSVFLACQVFGKHMVEAGNGGSIVNISSASAGPPLSKVLTYSITKAGVNQITQFLAREWAPYRIRVNAIRPGFFPAGQNRAILSPDRVAQIMNHTPMKRFGEPEELIGAALFLASERASSFVTGAILTVDGGFTAMTI